MQYTYILNMIYRYYIIKKLYMHIAYTVREVSKRNRKE